MTDLLTKITSGIIEPFLGFLGAIAGMFFIWGLIDYIRGAENEDKRTTGKRHVVWGVIGLFIMVCVWGIIQIIENFIAGI